MKYLGVHIDYKLSWKNHIDSITMKLSKTIGLLSKIRHFVPFHTLVSIYNSLVVPYLRYGLIAWGQTGKTQLNKLLILQKRALRFMCFADRCDHAIPLFLRAQTLPIHFLLGLSKGNARVEISASFFFFSFSHSLQFFN